MTDEHIRRGFSAYTSGDIGENHYQYGRKFIGQKISIKLLNGRETIKDSIESKVPFSKGKLEWDNVADGYRPDVAIYNLFRINADRDIVPEVEIDTTRVEHNGEGATNIIRRYFNDESCNEELWSRQFLMN